MYTEADADRIDATTKPGDVLIVRESPSSDSEYTAIVRDDRAEEIGDSMSGEHWIDDPGDDPMGLFQHIRYADKVYRLGEPIEPSGV